MIETEQPSFLDAYTSFIADLGKRARSDAWWATWLSSRNRFLSPLRPTLEAIYRRKPHRQDSSWKFLKQLTLSFERVLRYCVRSHRDISETRGIFAPHVQRYLEELSEHRIYLIKTFAYSHSFSKHGFNDPFFGSLPEYLRREQKLNVLTIFDAIGGLPAAWNASAHLKHALPYQAFLHPMDVLTALWRVVRGTLKPPATPIIFEGQNLSAAVRRQYLLDLLTPEAMQTFLIQIAFERITRSFKISHFLLTQENNIWERMCILTFRRFQPQTRILGYQHAVVPEASANMFPAPGELDFTPTPDQVLTVGEEAARILCQYGDYSTVPVVPCCGLRFEYLRGLQPENEPLSKTLLVALEGVPESVQMLNEVLKQSADRKDWKILIRPHPALPLDQLKKRLIIDPSSLTHVEVSRETSVLSDLRRSSFVIYWGSTVAMEALALGKPVIHFDIGSLLSFDPLFQCHDLKWTLRPEQNLFALLERISNLSESELDDLRNRARQYISNYFWPITPQALAKFV